MSLAQPVKGSKGQMGDKLSGLFVSLLSFRYLLIGEQINHSTHDAWISNVISYEKGSLDLTNSILVRELGSTSKRVQKGYGRSKLNGKRVEKDYERSRFKSKYIKQSE